MAEQSNTRGKLEHALQELAGLGESARLQLHLLRLDAAERKQELGVSLESLEQKLDRGLEQAISTAAGRARQMTAAVREFLGQAPPERSALRVRAIMSEGVRTCRTDDSLNRAAQIMWESDCGATPVVDAEGKLRGMITDRDICMAAYTKGAPLSAIPVRDAMSKHVQACAPSDTPQYAASVMAESQVRRLPVLDAEGRPIGVVSLADIARSASLLPEGDAAQLVFELLRAISKRRPNEARARESIAAE